MLGCGSESSEEPVRWTPPPPSTPEVSIAFDQMPELLALGLREERALHVVVDPPGSHEVNFVLLGGSLDARLDRATVETNDEGRASVLLRAPNKATTFRVRTWIMGGPAAEINVSTSGDGFAPVEIIPIYKGNRLVTDWTASIVARATCADVAPLLPAEVAGALPGHALVGEPLVVQDAPVGPSLAVTVRAGEFAWGCSDASGLVAGETTTVKVNVIDKPIDLRGTNLEVTLALKPDPTAYTSLLKATSTLVLDNLVPKEGTPATALLDAMASRVPEPMAAAFDDARTLGAWDTLASDHLSLQPASLQSALEAWFLLGVVNEPSEIVATLTALPNAPGSATLSPLRFGSVAAQDAGMPGTHLAKLTVDVGDVLHLGGSLYWLPSRYFGGVIARGALQDAPEGTTMADMLSSLAACDVLGQTLGGFDTCDGACLAGLCHEALVSLWENAIDASALSGNIGHINIAAAVTASVDDTAVPVAFQGSWLGSISDGNLVAKISKAEISAKLPEVPPVP